MNYVVDEVKRSKKEDVPILTHPRVFPIGRQELSYWEYKTLNIIHLIR